MSKKFVPPLPQIDPPGKETIESLKHPSKEKEERVKAVTKPIRKQEKNIKRAARRKWFANNLIDLIGLLFAFIAALPVIIQGIDAILRLLR